MALTAQSVALRATQVLQDPSSIRWLISEIVQWLNDGQREIVLHRPDANPVTGTGTLAAGTRQTLVGMTGIANPAKVVDIMRNMAATSNKYAVRLCDREILDAQTPGWHATPASASIVHFMFDPRSPLVFYVYPPATTLAQLEILYSAYPTDVAAPSGSDYTSVTGNIGIADIFGNALLDYILYRCYLKDSEYAGNRDRAMTHGAAFATSMGIEFKGTLMNAPALNVGYNKNSMPNRNPTGPK